MQGGVKQKYLNYFSIVTKLFSVDIKNNDLFN